MREFDEKYYWDKVSSDKIIDYTNKNHKDEYKVILSEIFPDLLQYMNQLYWVNATMLYMNAYLGVSQKKISSMFGISQYGVSKRYRASKKKLKIIMSKPYHNRNRVFNILNIILNHKDAEILFVYYNINMFSLVKVIMSSTMSVSSSNDKLNRVLEVFNNIYKRRNDKESMFVYIKAHNIHFDMDSDYEKLKISIEKLHDFFESIKRECLYGSYLFKKNDNDRNNFDSECLFD